MFTSHSEVQERRPAAASCRAARQREREGAGGDDDEKGGGEGEEEVGWCETDQTMDVRRVLLFSSKLQAEEKRGVEAAEEEEEEKGGVITRRVFSFKRLRFVTSRVDSSFFTKSNGSSEVRLFFFFSDFPSSKQVYQEAVRATVVFH